MLRRFVLALILSLLATGIARAEARSYCAPDAANLVVYVDKTTPYDETDKRALIDGIVPEPVGGAHREPEQMAEILKGHLQQALAGLEGLAPEALVERRQQRLASYGRFVERT